MFDRALAERNALSDQAPIEAGGRLSVAVAKDCARFSLRFPAECREQASQGFGTALPARIAEMTVSGERIALCLGPDEWFLMAPSEDAAKVAAAMQGASSLVDISHREVGIEVKGAAAGLALAAISTLDLDAMPAPSATRTILDKAQVVLVKHSPEHYRIEVWQSFASHLWGLLQAAAREIALDI